MIYTPLTALAALNLRVDATIEPVLTEEELTAILAENFRFSDWTANTYYPVGALVSGSGRLWRRYEPGTSGAVNPFPPLPYGRYFYMDGVGSWQDYGPVYPDNYDMPGAARAAWLMKANKDAMLIDVSEAGQKLELTGRRDFALKRAAMYAPRLVA